MNTPNTPQEERNQDSAVVAETGDMPAVDPYADYDPLHDDFGHDELGSASEEAGKPRMGLMIAVGVALIVLILFLVYSLFYRSAAPEPQPVPQAVEAPVAADPAVEDTGLELLPLSIEEPLPETEIAAKEELDALQDEQNRLAEQNQELEAQISDAEELSALKAQMISELEAQIAALEAKAAPAAAADQSAAPN